MSAKLNEEIPSWWVTASDLDPNRPVRWEDFFEDPQDNHWGGPDWIRAPQSIARIREMRAGDVVVCYQASRRMKGIVGLVYLETDGYQDSKSRKYDSFDLCPSPIVRLNTPVPLRAIRRLPNAKKDIEFIRILRGTVFRITPTGFRKIRDLILKYNPKQSKEISRFLSVKPPTREPEIPPLDEREELKLPHRATLAIQRVIRDSAVSKELKQLYQYQCQVCGTTIELPDGKRYAEIHHLQPVGKPHNGKDGKPNTIVVCPQHHAMFDLGAIAIDPKSLIIKHWNPSGSENGSPLIQKHHLDKRSLNYHYKLFKGARR
jgi:predicted RNA-binding protein with PUA-like domain